MAKPTGYGGRDMPDFGISDTFLTKAIVTDLGEVAARLGAPNLFDRTGTIIWYDQFVGGLNNWQLYSSLGHEKPALVASPYLYQPYAAKLHDVCAVGDSCTMLANLPFPYESAMGVEFAYYPLYSECQLSLECKLYTGSALFYFKVRLGLYTGDIHILDSTDTYVLVYNDPLGFTIEDGYNIVKVVVDLSSKMYSRLMFNKYDINIKSVGLSTGASTRRPRLTVALKLEGIGIYANTVYIDNVIVTLDEPI